MKHPVANTSDGAAVYVDLIQSPASISISRDPHIVTLIKELLAIKRIAGRTLTLEVDFGRNVGNTDIVETTEKDRVVYAKRLKQETFTRFVRSRIPLPTSFITIILRKDAAGDYELYDAWLGPNVPSLPGTTTETAESKDFWMNHAFVIEGQSLQTRSLTLTCPF